MVPPGYFQSTRGRWQVFLLCKSNYGPKLSHQVILACSKVQSVETGRNENLLRYHSPGRMASIKQLHLGPESLICLPLRSAGREKVSRPSSPFFLHLAKHVLLGTMQIQCLLLVWPLCPREGNEHIRWRREGILELLSCLFWFPNIPLTVVVSSGSSEYEIEMRMELELLVPFLRFLFCYSSDKSRLLQHTRDFNYFIPLCRSNFKHDDGQNLIRKWWMLCEPENSG